MTLKSRRIPVLIALAGLAATAVVFLIKEKAGEGGEKQIESPSKKSLSNPIDLDWPNFRGNSRLDGYFSSNFAPPFKIVWRWDSKLKKTSSPVISKNLIYLLGESGTLIAFDFKKGKQAWKFNTSSRCESAPLLNDGLIMFGDDSGFFHILDSNDGSEKAKCGPFGQIKASANFAKISDGESLAIFGTYDSTLIAIDCLSWRTKWRYKCENYVNGTPALYEKIVAFGSCDSKLRLLSLDDGKEILSMDTGSYIPASPSISSKGILYCANYSGKIIAYDLPKSKLIWEFSSEDAQFASCPAVSADHLIAASKDGSVYCFDANGGKLLWQFKAKGSMESSPIVSGSYVVAPSEDGRIYVISLADGRLAWEFDSGAPFTASPASADGLIIACNDDGIVFAFGN